jgi:hypothetical protein
MLRNKIIVVTKVFASYHKWKYGVGVNIVTSVVIIT